MARQEPDVLPALGNLKWLIGSSGFAGRVFSVLLIKYFPFLGNLNFLL